MRTHMEQIAGEWRSRLGQSEPGKRVHLLHSLNAVPAPTTKKDLHRRRSTRL
jgi:hypothetical protein